jgi:hypothetical protein
MCNIFVESMCSHSVTVDGKVVTVHIMDTAWKVRLIFIILFFYYHFGIFKLFLHAFNLSMLKWKTTKHHTVGTASKSNRTMVERRKIDTSSLWAVMKAGGLAL